MKYLWTIVSLVCVSYVVNAQDYVPFPTSSDSAVWFEGAWNINGGADYELFINGDTVIGGKEYIKIYRKEDASMPGFYWAAIREQNKVIYLRDFFYKNLTADTILYDFNVQIGDTVNWYDKDDVASNPFIVLDIDSVQINNTYRKRFKLQTQILDDFYVIEGMGSNKGLIPIYLEFENAQDLYCFRLNGNIIWQNWWNSGCYVSTKELKVNSKITIHPNPTTDFLNLTFATIESRTFMIFNQLGQLVLNQQSSDSNVSLALQTLPKGFYVLAIQTELGTVTKKIVKQ